MVNQPKSEEFNEVCNIFSPPAEAGEVRMNTLVVD